MTRANLSMSMSMFNECCTPPTTPRSCSTTDSCIDCVTTRSAIHSPENTTPQHTLEQTGRHGTQTSQCQTTWCLKTMILVSILETCLKTSGRCAPDPERSIPSASESEPDSQTLDPVRSESRPDPEI